jgi:hypothetical protein
MKKNFKKKMQNLKALAHASMGFVAQMYNFPAEDWHEYNDVKVTHI